jgi:enediyne biosynthesis protein CalE5
MMETTTLDRLAYREATRREWREAAAGWRRWFATLEAPDAMPQVGRVLVEQARVRPGHRVLDVGAGYGEPGLSLLRAVSPGGEVLLQDLSGDMLAFARDRAEWVDLRDVDVHYLEGDVEELDLEDPSLDAIVSRSVIMYLVDPAGTLARLRSHLRPGGRLAASVWAAPERVGFAAPVSLIRGILELPPPPAGSPGLFALSDEPGLEEVVAEAGYEDVTTGAVTTVFEFASAERATAFLRECAPPVTALVEGHPADVQQDVWSRVTEEAWAPFVGDDGRVRLPNEALWVAATNPG